MEHLTGRPQGDRIDAVKNSRILAPWWPRISMSWAKRRGYCSHGICSIRFLFFALNEGCFLGYTEDCSEIIKEKSQESSYVGRKNGPCCKRHQKKNKCRHVLPNKKSKKKREAGNKSPQAGYTPAPWSTQITGWYWHRWRELTLKLAVRVTPENWSLEESGRTRVTKHDVISFSRFTFLVPWKQGGNLQSKVPLS